MNQTPAMPKEHEIELVSEPGIQESDIDTYSAFDDAEIPKELAKILNYDGNLAEDYADEELYALIQSKIASDEESMTPHIKRYERALKLARMADESGDKTFPFVGASRVMMSYLMEGALDFWARTYPIIAERKQICMVETYGDKTPEKDARAERVSDFVNYDLRKGIPNWRDSMSKALLALPITGSYFRRTWHDPLSGKRKSQLLYTDELICDHTKSSFTEDLTKSFKYLLSKSKVTTYIRAGIFKEFDYGEDDELEQDLEFCESHCWLDLDGDGIVEPYIAVLCESKEEVVSLVPRFQIEDVTVTEDNQVVMINGEDQFTITTFIPDPNGSFLGWGWGILLGDMFESINTAVRQLIDAGTLSNTAANSGFISIGRNGPRGRGRKGKMNLVMGQFTGVEMDSIGQNIWQPSFAGPSSTLYNLVESLKTDIKSIITVGQQTEASPGEAAELYLARLQQGLKLPTAIMVNVYQGITRELERLQEIYINYLTDEEYQEVLDDVSASVIADFSKKGMDLQLTSDPTQGSEEERIHKSKIVLELAQQNPALDLRKAMTDYLVAIGVSDVDGVFPPPQPQQPDPVLIIQNKLAESEQAKAAAEQMSAQATQMSAIARMMSVQVDMAKVQAEIEEIESKTLKNLSDAESKSSETRLKQLKTQMDAARGMFEDARKLFETDQRSSVTLAGDTSSQGFTSSDTGAV